MGLSTKIDEIFELHVKPKLSSPPLPRLKLILFHFKKGGGGGGGGGEREKKKKLKMIKLLDQYFSNGK